MGLFSGQLLKVIDWLDDGKDVVAYKFPMDGRQIMYGSKLTVRESQVAIFMNKGEIADIFGPGMYKLETSNLPFLTKLLSLPYGFKSPFFADVFFVNTKQFINQKWGTSNPIMMRDKEFGSVRIRAFGTFSFKVDKPDVFLKQLLGTNSSFSTSDVSDYLKSMLVSSISDTIAESKISAIDIAGNLKEFNVAVQKSCAEDFTEIGLSLTKIIIENVSLPDEVEKVLDTRSSMGIISDKMDTFIKYQSAQAIRDAAQNTGSGVANVGVGLGTGIALGDIMRDALKGSQQPAAQAPSAPQTIAAGRFCSVCGAAMAADAKFCPECGAKQDAVSVCAKCGAKLAPGAKFCPECGTKV